MKIQNDARYAKSDEWVRVEGGVAVVGVSDYACLLYTSPSPRD